MAISNCLFSPTSENPRGYSVWYALAKFRANPTQLLKLRPLGLMPPRGDIVFR